MRTARLVALHIVHTIQHCPRFSSGFAGLEENRLALNEQPCPLPSTCHWTDACQSLPCIPGMGSAPIRQAVSFPSPLSHSLFFILYLFLCFSVSLFFLSFFLSLSLSISVFSLSLSLETRACAASLRNYPQTSCNTQNHVKACIPQSDPGLMSWCAVAALVGCQVPGRGTRCFPPNFGSLPTWRSRRFSSLRAPCPRVMMFGLTSGILRAGLRCQSSGGVYCLVCAWAM